jgi:potassium-transporting ATPase KdpC subunit
VKHLWTAIRMTMVTAVIFGIAYPLAMTGMAHVLFRDEANGSLVKKDGIVIGSRLIGQGFSSEGYFHARPSAAGAGYDAMASSFSNLGPTSQVLADRVRTDLRRFIATNPGLRPGSVPIDAVTTSASGLDPDITIANARAQAPRVAAARGMAVPTVLAIVDAHTTARQFGFLGEPRVNVLELNQALDGAAMAKEP